MASSLLVSSANLVGGQSLAGLADTILRPGDDGDVVGAFGQSDQFGSEVLLE